jgi:hypothetical protein
MSLPFIISALKVAKKAFSVEEEAKLAAEHAVRRHLPDAARHINVKVTPGDIHLDYEAIGELLRERCAAPINEIAQKVAANAAADANLPSDATVTVAPFVTDRAIAVVRVNHPAGDALEAKHGILKRAAAAEGLEVTSK